MTAYSEKDFCNAEDGIRYIFAQLGAHYGAAFSRHWAGMNLSMVKQTWQTQLGRYATYRPSMDFALANMNPDYVPSLPAFKALCVQGPRIPDKPNTLITKQYTTEEKVAMAKAKAEAMEKLKSFTNGFGKIA